MESTMQEVLAFVQENDVKFLRMAFCDLLGRQKNISIMPGELPRAFSQGISIDGSSIAGFSDVEKSDLLLIPDPATLHVLPWRPQQGRVVRFYCDIQNPDGTPFARDARTLLKQVVARAAQMGYGLKIGPECEFYLFKTDEDGYPVKVPLDEGGYLDVAPLDRGENVRREICLNLMEQGITPETSHHESGPGQNEIDFKHSDPMAAADNLITFRSTVKSIAERNGLFASFMPKPIEGVSGSGLHINLSLTKGGKNLFSGGASIEQTQGGQFLAGILMRAREITAFLNPLSNSYQRFGQFEAPKYVSWSRNNRSQLIRVPAAEGDYARIELRSPDPSIHPHLALALILSAGLDGIEQQLPVPNSVDLNLYEATPEQLQGIESLPKDLSEALDLAQNSEFVRRVLGQDLLDGYMRVQRDELDSLQAAPDRAAFEERRYFRTI